VKPAVVFAVGITVVGLVVWRRGRCDACGSYLCPVYVAGLERYSSAPRIGTS
jgi:hypothetical protein